MGTTNSLTDSALQANGRPIRLSGIALWFARFALLGLLAALLVPFALGLPGHFRGDALGRAGIGFRYDSAGQVILTPDPGLSADRAGLQGGEVLLAIDGFRVAPWTARSEILVRSMGPIGSLVTLEVVTGDGDLQRYGLRREAHGLTETGLSAEVYARFFGLIDLALVFGSLLPALIIFHRKSDDWMAMLVSLGLVSLAISNTSGYLPLLVRRPDWVWTLNLLTVLYKISTLLLLYLFPNGRFVPRWTRKLAVLGVLWAGLFLLPYPYHPWAWPLLLGNLIDLGIYATGIYAQVHRYRRVSTPSERQQTKWVVWAMAIAFLAIFGYGFPLFILPALQQPSAAFFRYQLVGRPISALGLVLFPAAMTIAVLRHRLYDIDLIINRTLVYVPLTAMVAGIATGFITLSQRLLLLATGAQSIAAAALVAFATVTLFTPAKERLQAIVDRYFKESPDPARRLGRFQAELESRPYLVNPAQICKLLLEEAVEAFGATGGAIYLKRSGRALGEHATARWSGKPAIQVRLRWDEGPCDIGSLALAGRKSGAEYSPAERLALQTAAQAVARAVYEDRIPQ